MGQMSVLENAMSLLEVNNLKVHFPRETRDVQPHPRFCRIDALPHRA